MVYAAVVCLCVCVCLSVTRQYCIEIAELRIAQTMPHDSPVTSFLMPQILAKFERDHPEWGTKMQVELV